MLDIQSVGHSESFCSSLNHLNARNRNSRKTTWMNRFSPVHSWVHRPIRSKVSLSCGAWQVLMFFNRYGRLSMLYIIIIVIIIIIIIIVIIIIYINYIILYYIYIIIYIHTFRVWDVIFRSIEKTKCNETVSKWAGVKLTVNALGSLSRYFWSYLLYN